MNKLKRLMLLPPMRQFGEYVKNYFTRDIGILPFTRKVKSIREKAQIMNAAWDAMNRDIQVEE